jgi:hypothetical protein
MFSCDDMKNIDDIFYNFQCIPGVKSGIRRDFLFQDYVIKNGITYLHDSKLCFCVARDMLKQNIVDKVVYIDTVNTIESLEILGRTKFISENLENMCYLINQKRFLDLMCLQMIVRLDIDLKNYLFVIDSISDVDDILYEKFESVQKDILRKGASIILQLKPKLVELPEL